MTLHIEQNLFARQGKAVTNFTKTLPEQQNIEYKESWHDDYLKWIAGFANANGGTIYIGKDDGGNVVGVSDYKKLLEDLPNKIRDVLGIMAEVNLRESGGLYYLFMIHRN